MELFTITYEPNKIIYKGTNKKIYTKSFDTNPLWLGDINTAQKYGKFIHKFKIKKQLKLIDVTNGIFHNNFIAEINHHYKDGTSSSHIKRKLLLPFGLPNLNNQLRLKKLEKNNLYNKDIVDDYIGFFNDKHRCSIDNFDQETTILMKILYPSFDGYISELHWPSYFHDGFLLPELCIFDPSSSLEYLGLYNNINSGGFLNENIDSKSKKKINLNNNINSNSNSNINNLPEDLIKRGYTSWDQLCVIVPGKMEDKPIEYYEKIEKKLKKLMSK